jgi:hypothetical protein
MIDPENTGSTILEDVGNYLPVDIHQRSVTIL